MSTQTELAVLVGFRKDPRTGDNLVHRASELAKTTQTRALSGAAFKLTVSVQREVGGERRTWYRAELMVVSENQSVDWNSPPTYEDDFATRHILARSVLSMEGPFRHHINGHGGSRAPHFKALLMDLINDAFKDIDEQLEKEHIHLAPAN